ncbi:MAG: hypothetical protein ACLGPL_06570, partial [Acidobacteriota bacterium]
MSDAAAAELIPEATPKPVPVPKPEDEKPKKKAAPKKKKAKAPEFDPSLFTPESIATQIQGVHEIAAVFLGPAARIGEGPALAMGKSIAQIIELYGMEWVMKYMPWVGLVLTVAACETPVALAVKADIARKREAKQRGEVPDHSGSPSLSIARVLPPADQLREEIRELRNRVPEGEPPKRRGRPRKSSQ